MTGRTPNTGVYLVENRIPVCEICVSLPADFDDALWPMLGWLAGVKSPNGIPVLTGLEALHPTQDDLKALCAAFGTTSAAAMLHVRGHTPEGNLPLANNYKNLKITIEDLENLWHEFNTGTDQIDLVAIGSPHASLMECRKFADFLDGYYCAKTTKTIVTVGRKTLAEMTAEGVTDRLQKAGVRVIPDICWCSITEPVFPVSAMVLMTNSGKYAHYGKGLTGREVRFGSLRDCARAALDGHTDTGLPSWLLKNKRDA